MKHLSEKPGKNKEQQITVQPRDGGWLALSTLKSLWKDLAVSTVYGQSSETKSKQGS